MSYRCQILDPSTERNGVREGTMSFGGRMAGVTYYMRDRKPQLAEVSFPGDEWSEADAREKAAELGGTLVEADGAEVVLQGLAESDTIDDLREAGVMELTAPQASLTEGVHAVATDSVFIRAGRNKTGRRLYEGGFLKSNLQRFSGALGHVDHPTTNDERQRPERSVATLATVARNPHWDESQQAVVGDIEFIDNEAGRAMAETYRHPEVRKQAGVSIYWPHGVKVRRAKVAEGGMVDVPVELLGGADEKFNLDLVTRPTAGGSVTQIKESDQHNAATDEGDDESMDWTALTRADIEANRPDLLQPAADNADAEQTTEETVPVVSTPTVESDRIEQLERRVRQADGREIVRAVLDEAGLPVATRALVEGHFAAAECVDGQAAALRESVTAEVAAVKAAMKEAGGTRVTGIMAESDAGEFNAAERIKQSVNGKPAAAAADQKTAE